MPHRAFISRCGHLVLMQIESTNAISYVNVVGVFRVLRFPSTMNIDRMGKGWVLSGDFLPTDLSTALRDRTLMPFSYLHIFSREEFTFLFSTLLIA